MKRFIRVGISLLLVLTMLFSLCSTALADGKQSGGEEPFTYLSIGDSTTNGYGLEGYTDDVRGFNQIVTKSYPYLIKEMLEAEGKTVQFYPYAGSAMRPDDLDAILDPDHWDDDYTHRVFSGKNADGTGGEEWFETFANQLPGVQVDNCKDGEVALRSAFYQAIGSADLITYYLGSNSFGTFLQAGLTSGRYGDDDTLEDLLNHVNVEVPFTAQQIQEIRTQVLSLLAEQMGTETVSALESQYGALADLCVHAFVSFVIYFEKNIQSIRMINSQQGKHCDIVVLGLHNYIDFIRADFNGKEIELGKIYGYLLELANVYMARLSKSADDFYYADLESIDLQLFWDELLEGKPVGELQNYLDDYIGGMAKSALTQMSGGALSNSVNGITNQQIGAMLRHWNADGFTTDADFALLAQLAPAMLDGGLPELPAGLELADGIRLAWLYYTKDDAFVEAVYPLVENTSLASSLRNRNGSYVSFSRMQSSLNLLRMFGSLLSIFGGGSSAAQLSELNSMLTQLDAVGQQLEDVRKYGKIQDTLLSCVNTDPLSLTEIQGFFGADVDEAAIAANILGATVNGDALTDTTRLAVNLNFLFLFNNGLCIHPTDVGCKTIADTVWNAYQGKNVARPYMNKKIMNQLADLVEKLTANVTMPETSGNFLCGADAYETYVSMGDSTVFGFGLGEMGMDEPAFTQSYGYLHCASAAYPELLRQELGIDKENFTQLAMGCLRVEDLRFILEDDYQGDWYTDTIVALLNTMCDLTPDARNGVQEAQDTYRTKLADADLITLGAGDNNFSTFAGRLMEEMSQGRMHEFDWARYSNNDLVQYKSVLQQITSALKKVNPDANTELLELLGQAYLYEYVAILENYEQVLDDIHALNPDATVLVTGIYNPFETLYYKAEDSAEYKPIQLGKVASLLVAKTNTFLMGLAQERDYCGYVDISDAELIADTDPAAQTVSRNIKDKQENSLLPVYVDYIMLNNGVAGHASEAGHAYIKEQLMGTISHQYGEWVEEVPATCTENGTLGHYHCNACGNDFNSNHHKLDSLTIPAGHSFSTEWSKDNASHWHNCANCAEVSDKAAHDFGDDNVCDACGYKKSVTVCHGKQTVSTLESGKTYTFFANDGTALDTVTVESDNGKWLVKADNGYLTFANGTLSRSNNRSDAYGWTYSGGRFSASVTTQSNGSNSGWFGWFGRGRTTTTTYYLTDTNGFAVSTTAGNTATLYLLMDNNEHQFGAWQSNSNGAHTRVCVNCGNSETENCVYDATTHKCVCGAADPDYATVSISVTEQRTGRGFLRFSSTQYRYTITTTATGTTVSQIRYSTDNTSWTSGSSYTGSRQLSTLYVQAVDANGTVYNYTWHAN